MVGKLLKGILGWGIIGFVAGLLFAPEKGEDARKKVSEAIEKGKEKFNEVKSSFDKSKEN
ncbi:YtxH domain-containing protein [Candidatus Saganbacteria bacterium]|nr:YtxH domain-containing protein [Candidatus Saganbacteria bacterium]